MCRMQAVLARWYGSNSRSWCVHSVIESPCSCPLTCNFKRGNSASGRMLQSLQSEFEASTFLHMFLPFPPSVFVYFPLLCSSLSQLPDFHCIIKHTLFFLTLWYSDPHCCTFIPEYILPTIAQAARKSSFHIPTHGPTRQQGHLKISMRSTSARAS
jgi:hypothetical protein